MGKGKKKGKGRDEFVNDIPVAERTREFEGLLESLGPDGLKERIASAPRDVLDRWVTELAGRAPHDSQQDDFVRASLGRWIDGDKNWGDDPKRMQPVGKAASENGNGKTDATTHTPAEGTPSTEEDAMTTKKNGKKTATPKPVPPKKEKAAKTPKAKKEPKVLRRPDGSIIKRPWGERTAFFVKLFKANKEAKLTGEQIMAKAVKEFGKENIGKGAWTLERLIEAVTAHAKKGMYGLSKDDLPLNVK